jgi:CDP-glucose 4,6-dehydratase
LEGAYNFGPGDESCVSTGDLAELFCRFWGEGASWTEQSDGGPHEANFLKLDCSKAKNALGWKPKWDIKTALKKVVEFSKENNNNKRLNCIDNQIDQFLEK